MCSGLAMYRRWTAGLGNRRPRRHSPPRRHCYSIGTTGSFARRFRRRLCPIGASQSPAERANHRNRSELRCLQRPKRGYRRTARERTMRVACRTRSRYQPRQKSGYRLRRCRRVSIPQKTEARQSERKHPTRQECQRRHPQFHAWPAILAFQTSLLFRGGPDRTLVAPETRCFFDTPIRSESWFRQLVGGRRRCVATHRWRKSWRHKRSHIFCPPRARRRRRCPDKAQRRLGLRC